MKKYLFVIILFALANLLSVDTFSQNKPDKKQNREQRKKELAMADSIALAQTVQMIEQQKFVFEAIREISNNSPGYKIVDNSLFITINGKEAIIKYKAINTVGETEVKDEEFWGSVTNYEFLQKKDKGNYRLSITVVFSKGKLDMRFETSKSDITYLIIDKEFVFTELGDNYEGRIIPLQ